MLVCSKQIISCLDYQSKFLMFTLFPAAMLVSQRLHQLNDFRIIFFSVVGLGHRSLIKKITQTAVMNNCIRCVC